MVCVWFMCVVRCVVYVCGGYIWFMWWVYMVYVVGMCGGYIWYVWWVYMVYVYGGYIWYVCMVGIYGMCVCVLSG